MTATVSDNDDVPIPGRYHYQTPHIVREMKVIPTEMDQLWQKELSAISAKERELNDANLQGIKSLAVEETPEKLGNALNEMQKAIDELPDEQKRGHLRGIELGSMYIQSLAFRLKFLRSDRFDAKKAAIRYCNCLNFLTEQFGEFALLRRLYITDLSKEELEYCKEGQFQILPSRDGLGRRIAVFNTFPTTRKYSIPTMFKAYVYLLHAVLTEDVSTQKHGMVYIGVLHVGNQFWDDFNKGSTEDLHRVHRMYAATPLFWGSVHLCVPDGTISRMLTALFMAWLGPEARKLLRIHRGNRIECDYSLQRYGIDVSDMPQWHHSGKIKTKNHFRLMNTRLAMDQWECQEERRFIRKEKQKRMNRPSAIQPFAGIECPEVNFVILAAASSQRSTNQSANNNDNDSSSGHQQHQHPGNRAFAKIMESHEGFQEFLHDRKDSQFRDRSQIDKVADDLLCQACFEGYGFVVYNTEKGYYEEVVQQEELRRLVVKLMRRSRCQFWAKADNNKQANAVEKDSSSPNTTPTDIPANIRVGGGTALDLSDRSNEKDCCGDR